MTLRAPTNRPEPAEAMRIAVALARELGAVVDRGSILRAGSNIVIELSPDPIVAKVAARRGRVRATPAWFAREVEIARYLRSHHLPVVTPSSIVEAGPHCYEGEVVSFWDVIAVTDGTKAPHIAAAAMRAGHDALASYAMASSFDIAAEAIGVLRLTPAEQFIEGEGALLGQLVDPVFGTLQAWDGPVQALFGDSEPGNLLISGETYVWCDFEDAHVGSVLWDVACLIAPARVAGDEVFCARALHGYGLTSGAAGHIDAFVVARVLHQAVWSAFVNNPGPTSTRLARLGWLEQQARLGRIGGRAAV